MFNKSKLTRYLKDREDRRIERRIERRSDKGLTRYLNEKINTESQLIDDTIDKAIDLVHKDGFILSMDSEKGFRRLVVDYTIELLIDTRRYTRDDVINDLLGRIEFEVNNTVGDILQYYM